MKRIVPIILSLLLVLLMAGCTQTESPETTPEPAPSWIVLPETQG